MIKKINISPPNTGIFNWNSHDGIIIKWPDFSVTPVIPVSWIPCRTRDRMPNRGMKVISIYAHKLK
jgi:hypothetical protein